MTEPAEPMRLFDDTNLRSEAGVDGPPVGRRPRSVPRLAAVERAEPGPATGTRGADKAQTTAGAAACTEDSLAAGALSESASAEPLQPRLVTVAGAAKLLGIGRSTAYELIASGHLTLVHIRRSARVPVASVDRFIASLEQRSGHDCPTPSAAVRQRSTRVADHKGGGSGPR